MTITQSSTRLVAVAAGVAVALVLMLGASLPVRAASLSQTQIQSILNLLTSFGADQGTINNVSAALNGQTTTTTTTTTTSGGGVCPFTWSRSLQTGSTGADVKALQQFLNMSAATMVAASGNGSPGMETTYFGPATKAAVMKFQAANGISAIGLVGPMTRAKLNSLCTTGGSVTPTPTPTPGTPGPVTTGTGLSVMASVQPANAVIPYSVARAPFTKFTVTASNDGDVTLNNVTVQRQGISKDTDIANVELLDENGNIIGLTKTLNSNHQAVIGSSIVIPRGTSRTFTVAADTAAAATLNSGDIVSFAVVSINSSATVNGSLPIVGASNTMNNTLAIGSVTAAKGTNDPGAANTENVGQTNYIFSSVRLTAGSAEDVNLKSIRFHQVGSASQGYLQNVVVVIDGTSYPTTVSTDNYYLANFPGNGVLITKGNSKDVAIQGDMVNGSSNTVEFDIQKRNDINAVGATYGFGILPAFGSGSTAGTVHTSDDPYYQGFQVTLNAGTINASTGNISATNVAVNQQNQTLGGWSVQIIGEPVTIGKMIFNLTATGGHANVYTDITNVSLVDQNGNVVAGPVDATVGALSTANAIVTFTDSVTLPPGTTNLFLKGKLGTDLVSGNTVAASTTPSTQWTSAVGQTTGKSLTASPASALTSATMTIKAQALSVSVATTPIAQVVIAGANQFTFANIILDATASGEDVRVTTLPVEYTWTGNANDLTNCYLYNGSTNLTDQHVYSPSSATSPATGTDVSFSLNSGGLVIPKGTSVTVSVKCDVRSGSSGTYKWGLLGTESIGASGKDSGNTVGPTTGTAGLTVTANAGNLMTGSSSGGAMTVALDSGSPNYGVASAGATGVDLGHLRFTAANEDLNLKQLGLQLTNGTRTDLVGNQVTLWDATTNTQIGTAVFTTGATATSSQIASGAFTIPKDGYRILIVKGDMANISNSGPLTASGDLVKVGYDGNNISGTNGTYAVGAQSNTNVQPSTASDVSANGTVLYKSFPTFTYDTSNVHASAGSNVPVLTLNVAADSKGDVRLYQLEFVVSTTTATFTAPALSGPNGAVNTTGITGPDNNGVVTVLFDSSTNTTDRIISAGSTKSYTLRGTVAYTGNTNTTGSVSVALKADGAALVYPAAGNGLASTTGATAALNAGINVWSPISTSTTSGSLNDVDWTNSYGLTGCFKDVGLTNNCLAKTTSN